MGRPTLYTPELADEVCRRMAEGESLRAICGDAGMPSEAAVRLWATEDRDGFAARYARAMEARAEHWADEVVAIADEVQHAEDPTAVAAAKLRVDARKWIASKLLPRYSDRKEIDHKSSDGSMSPTRIELVVPAVSGDKPDDSTD